MIDERDSQKLPVRPRPVPGEAAIGFLKRVAKANGYERLRELQNAVKTFDGLCQALSLSMTERNALFGPYPSYWGQNELSKGLVATDFNHSLIRWCPLCLRESSYLRGQWMLKISCVCGRHSVWLHDRCPGCGARQQLERADFEQCTCGTWLAEAQSMEIVTKTLVGVSQAIEASISGKAALPGFPLLSMQEWLRLIRYLGQFSEVFQPAKPGKIARLHQLEIASALLLQVSWLLDQWPGNFHAVLQAIQRKSENQLSIRRTFGPMYRVLYTDLSAQCFQFVRDEFERYLHEHWPAVVCKRNRAFKPETIAVHPRMTLKQVSKKAGVAPSTVRHFIEAELISSGQIALPSGRQTCSIHRHNAAHIATLAKDCLTLGESARLLALPEGRVRQLIVGDLLKPLVSRAQNKAATWLISKRHVQELFFRGTGSSLGQPIVIVSHILKYWHLRQGEWIDLVQALSSHQLAPLGEQIELVPLGNVILNERKARLWLTEQRYASGASISVDEAAKRLGLKQQVVYDLVKLGLLATIRDDLPGRRVTQASIEDFRMHYISLAEYAKSLNRAPRWLLQTLPVKPISGPMIDGSRQYFFRRSDVYSEAFSVGDGIKSESLLSN
jgi:hypothetical protein